MYTVTHGIFFILFKGHCYCYLPVACVGERDWCAERGGGGGGGRERERGSERERKILGVYLLTIELMWRRQFFILCKCKMNNKDLFEIEFESEYSPFNR